MCVNLEVLGPVTFGSFLLFNWAVDANRKIITLLILMRSLVKTDRSLFLSGETATELRYLLL